jgi:soluble lytic murein transglycosylase
LNGFLIVIAASQSLATAAAQPHGIELETQREAFRIAYPAAERGETIAVANYLEQLTDYPLYPDLLGALLRATLATQPAAELDAFQAQFPDHPEARLLARARLSQAAKQNDWPAFLRLWDRAPQSDIAMRCYQLTAQAQVGAGPNDAQGLELWQVGRSQPKACDPVFASLKLRGKLTPAVYRQRLELALTERQFGLASYLARSLADTERRRVQTWQQMFQDPATTLIRLSQPGASTDIAVLEAGLTRLAYRDGDRTMKLWQQLSKRHSLPADLRPQLLRQTALGSAQRLEANAVAKLAQVPATATDEKVRQWRVRSALRSENPRLTLSALDQLNDNEANQAVNRYWRGRMLQELGSVDEAQQILAGLAQERGFYGFLAADWLDLPYAFGHTPTAMNPARASQLLTNPDFIRARELFYVGLFGRGRQLWERLVRALDQADQAQAALLANRWGWHSRAISTAGRAGLSHDLRLRFPIPDSRWLEGLPVDRSLVLGVARSESLFMSDVRSAAGAIGLMQLMPATGREVAQGLGINYRGQQTLVNPVANARLGSEYLNRMLRRFDQNRVLAAAAYNAGPHRVDRWLPRTGSMPAEVWLASIPFDETRGYVQRVLEAAIIMQWRMNGEGGNRLTHSLRPISGSNGQPIAKNR